MNLNKFFRQDKILITGASGLVGRNLFDLLKGKGLNVIGTYHQNCSEGLVYCDLTNRQQVKQLMFDVKHIFLFAAKTYGAEVMKNNPSALVTDTVSMNTNVLEVALGTKVKKIMFVSSSVVYQDSFKPLAEDDLDLNQNPYPLYMGVGWVKRYLEKICEFYSQLGLPINIVRPTTIYGRYDKYEEGKSHFIPAITNRILRGDNPLCIWGTGTDLKSLIYIDDLLRDMLKIFINYDGVDPFNLCADELTTVKEVVDVLLKETNCDIYPVYDSSKPGSIPYKSLLRNKFDSILGRERYTPFKEGAKTVVSWMNQEIRRNE